MWDHETGLFLCLQREDTGLELYLSAPLNIAVVREMIFSFKLLIWSSFLNDEVLTQPISKDWIPFSPNTSYTKDYCK